LVVVKEVVRQSPRRGRPGARGGTWISSSSSNRGGRSSPKRRTCSVSLASQNRSSQYDGPYGV
jgi:hypothetical protein